MNRRGSVTLPVLVAIGIASAIGLSLDRGIRNQIQETKINRIGKEVELASTSGLEVGESLLKSGTVKTFPYQESKPVGTCEYDLTIEKVGSDTYRITSVGKCGDVTKTKVEVVKLGSSWLPFAMESWNAPIFSTGQWQNAEISAEELSINGLDTDGSKKFLQQKGFVFVNGNPPDISKVYKEPVDVKPVTVSLPTVNCSQAICCDGDVSINPGHHSLSVVCTADGKHYDLQNIKDLTIYAKGRIIGKGFMLNHYPFNSIESVHLYSEGGVFFNRFVFGNKSIDSATIDIRSLGDIVFKKGFTIGNLHSDNGLTVNIETPGNLELGKSSTIGNLQLSGGDLNVNIEAGEITGSAWGGHHYHHHYNFGGGGYGYGYGYGHGHHHSGSGALNIYSFSADNVNVNIKTDKDLYVDAIRISNFSADSNLNVKYEAENIYGSILDLAGFSASNNLNLEVVAKENIDLGLFSLQQFSSNDNLTVKVLAGNQIDIGGTELSNFSGSGNSSTYIQGKKVNLYDGVSLNSMSLSGNNYVVIRGENINSDDSLFNLYSASFNNNNYFFAIADNDITAENLVNMMQMSFTGNVGFLFASGDDISGDIDIARVSMGNPVKVGLVAQDEVDTSINVLFNADMSGFDKDTLTNICNNGTGVSRDIACSLLSGSGSTGGKLTVVNFYEK